VRVAIVGAGLGGLAAAALLARADADFDVQVFEQARDFRKLGAGIQVAPNMVRVLRRIGIADAVIGAASVPRRSLSRRAETGELMLDFSFVHDGVLRYGEPLITIHRGELHAALLAAVPPSRVHFGRRVVDVDTDGSGARIRFEDHGTAQADLVIGADGIRSRVRDVLLGPDPPRFMKSSYRAMVPASRLARSVDDLTKWWGADRVFIAYFTSGTRDVLSLACDAPDKEWPHATSFVPSTPEALRAAMEGFEPRVQRIIDAAPMVTKWALYDRDSFPLWSRGPITLLGDAAHPMLPHAGLGGAMALEDAAVLSRCLVAERADTGRALARYEATRKRRTADVQQRSRQNDWLMDTPDGHDWVFDYDAGAEPLRDPG